jgi:hypothetical protein
VDVIDVHSYPNNKPAYEISDGKGGKAWIGPRQWMEIARKIDKPLMLGEFGALPSARSKQKIWKETPDYFESFADPKAARPWVEKTLNAVIDSGVQLSYWWCYQSDRPVDQNNPQRFDLTIGRNPELVRCIAEANKRLQVRLGVTPRSVEIKMKDAACERFLGFGAEWDSNYYTEHGVTDADFRKWKKGYLNLHKELARRGLRVELIGPDVGMPQGKREKTISEQWFYPGVRELKHVAAGYDVHRYALKSTVRAGELEKFVAKLRAYTLAHDPKAADKPLIVGEAGMRDGSKPPATNDNTPKFEYGLFMADYGVQAANGGAASVMAWMLDDNSHRGFTWGMWDNKPKGLGLKPWFYPWSLLCRYVPAGSRIVKTDLSSKDVRVLAVQCKRPDARQEEGWTFCIVNRASTSRAVKLQAKGGSRVSMRRYVYSKTSRKADRDGFPVAADNGMYDLGSGTSVTCDGESVTVLTSLK